ncbi:folylpolyglutamate synthase/dihydrofolate synthase family protein [Anaerococcus sp. ENR1011]|uniref:tetrahydrofolate synthase n=1 Tax=Anaerococcus groningensis TaxID=3115616 RepID=A0ABW9N1F8_9FIRM
MEKFDYKSAVDFIIGRPSSKGVHTLEKIRKLLGIFDNPQDNIKLIHVAGTNGKGSTSKILAQAFSTRNRVGVFTSPYISRINEAIVIDGKEISDKDFADLVSRIKSPVESLDNEGLYLTYFEVLTAIMYIYFYEQNVDIAIIETGLGGLLDSTNIVKKPLASVITTISIDHTNILGNSIEEIAYQKAGIIKEGVPVFIYPQTKEAMDVLVNKARKTNSKVYTFNKDEIEIKQSDEKANIFTFRTYKDVDIKLLGVHQIYNASLALMVLEYFKDEFDLDEASIKEALAKADNIGRLTEISKEPRVIVDGSHNKESIDALKEALKTFTYNRLIIGFSVLKDKDYAYIIDSLNELADELVVTSMDNPRAFSLEELKEIVGQKRKDFIVFRDNIKAYEYSKSLYKKGDLIVWCGSLYLISDLINYENQTKTRRY